MLGQAHAPGLRRRQKALAAPQPAPAARLQKICQRQKYTK
jgi:hypothetical protein